MSVHPGVGDLERDSGWGEGGDVWRGEQVEGEGHLCVCVCVATAKEKYGG